MSNFKWQTPLTDGERKALADYKDQTWVKINQALLNHEYIHCLAEIGMIDSAIRKGCCTVNVTLYRGTNLSFLHIEDGILHLGGAFISASVDDRVVGQFIERDRPAVLIIECTTGTNMAAFEFDAGLGEENERLLHRKSNFRIITTKVVENRIDATVPDGITNRFYSHLGRSNLIHLFHVECLSSV